MLHTITMRQSGNRKLGGMAATYRPVGATCPQSCPLLNNGCYAQRAFAGIAQGRAMKSRGLTTDFHGVDIVRWNVSGDVYTNDHLDTGYVHDMVQFHRDHPETEGYTYCHRAEDLIMAGMGPSTWPGNFTILASCDSLEDRELYKDLGFKTARTVSSPDEVAAGEVLCPYDMFKHRGYQLSEIPTNCRKCKLCFRGERDIAFVKF